MDHTTLLPHRHKGPSSNAYNSALPLGKWHLMGHHSVFPVWTAVSRFTTPTQPTRNFLSDGMSWPFRILDFSRIWCVYGVKSTRTALSREGFCEGEQHRIARNRRKRMPPDRFLCTVWERPVDYKTGVMTQIPCCSPYAQPHKMPLT